MGIGVPIALIAALWTTSAATAAERVAKGEQPEKTTVEKYMKSNNARSPVGRARGKVLNNLVTELLHVTEPPSHPCGEWTFTNPRDGWVFIRSTAGIGGTGKVWLCVDASEKEQAAVVHTKAESRTRETMRFLPRGEHKLKVYREGRSSVESLVVRAVPELIFCKFQCDPHVPAYRPYDWPFLEERVFAHVNCIVGGGDEKHQRYVEEWKRRGGKWIQEVYAKPYFEGMSADAAYAYWVESAGLANPLLDGIIADEFFAEDNPCYPSIMESVRRIRENEQFRGKAFYPYCVSVYGGSQSREFIKTVMDAGYPFAWERYLPEQPTEAAAGEYLQSMLSREMQAWRKALPGCQEHMIVCFGYLCAPPESLNVNPKVDYKVWMDMQFRHLATDPAFSGLYGLMEYTCGYADEEAVRWAAELYRHYGIEGKTEMLSKRYRFRYQLDHIQNPDFDGGTEGWTVEAAEEGSVDTRSFDGFSWLEGRYPKTSEGNMFLWTRRSAEKPNVLSQEIKNLQPGRLYSLKMFTADYRELAAGKSAEREHAVSIRLDNAELIPGKCFRHVFPSCYTHTLGSFNKENPLWLNYHVRVFRAKGKTSRLTISDWANEKEPGGPAGRELMFNFIEVQPYLE